MYAHDQRFGGLDPFGNHTRIPPGGIGHGQDCHLLTLNDAKWPCMTAFFIC